MVHDASLEVDDVHKHYDTARDRVDVLRGISFGLPGGGSLAITGPSGSGKSTLLQILGTLDQPSSGGVRIHGRDPFAMPEPELARFRNSRIGFVFQDHYLLPQYSVLENVLVPTLAYPTGDGGAARERARELIERVGLGNRLTHRPLVNGPSLVLCDEPTGSLDQATAGAVGDLLIELHDETTILVVVTHSLELAARFERRLELREGLCCEL